jgi:hypothetical protein
MASQAQRTTRGPGRTTRSRSAVAPGRTRASRSNPKSGPTTGPSASPIPATRAVYRLLVTQGMNSSEATSLTALVCGLPSTDLRWSLEQLNHLLFLRRMRETGRF